MTSGDINKTFPGWMLRWTMGVLLFCREWVWRYSRPRASPTATCMMASWDRNTRDPLPLSGPRVSWARVPPLAYGKRMQMSVSPCRKQSRMGSMLRWRSRAR
jgi:hypothetical protein